VLLTPAGAVVYAWSNSKNRLSALRAADGSTLWEMDAASGSPVVGTGLVYVFSVDEGLYALSASSGKKQWRSPEAGVGASNPLLDSTILYTGGATASTFAVLALDARTGRTLWEEAAISGSSETPFGVVAGTVYTSTGNAIRALNADNGTEMWRWSVPANQSMSPGPQVAQGVVYGGYTLYDSTDTVQFALSARDGSLLWSRTYPAPLIAMAAVDGIVYAAACSQDGVGGSFVAGESTIVSAATAGDGAHVWTKSMPRTVLTFTVAGTTAVLSFYPEQAGGILYPGGTGSETELRGLSLGNGQTTWSVASAGWDLTAAPVITGDWVCAGFLGQSIRVVNLHTGVTKWNLPMPTGSAPVVGNGIVFAVGADAMNVYGQASPEGTLYAVSI
jgi:outer membrane protein assembly factor BamB